MLGILASSASKILRKTVLDLVPFILVDGFLSHRQAVLVTQPRGLMDPTVSGTVCPWSLAYFKGQTRCLTLLAVLQIFWDDGCASETIDSHFPKFLASVAAVAVYHVPQTSLVSNILVNARLSAREGVRKAWSIAQWAAALMNLQSKRGSVDVNGCIQRWHSTAHGPYR